MLDCNDMSIERWNECLLLPFEFAQFEELYMRCRVQFFAEMWPGFIKTMGSDGIWLTNCWIWAVNIAIEKFHLKNLGKLTIRFGKPPTRFRLFIRRLRGLRRKQFSNKPSPGNVQMSENHFRNVDSGVLKKSAGQICLMFRCVRSELLRAKLVDWLNTFREINFA